jgi:MoxR-like ATPase
MGERKVSADGVTHLLPRPFLVLATQNPIELAGTFPLPEAQLDRFFLKTTLGYPNLDDELRIVQAQLHGHPLDSLRAVIDVADLRWIQAAVESVYIDPIIQRWLIELVRSTRELELVTVGASVRGSLALERAARARALLHGRPFVEPEDVEALFEPVLEHRVLVNPYRLDSENGGGFTHLDLARRCLELVPRPGIRLATD